MRLHLELTNGSFQKTFEASNLAKLFDLITVRESSAVQLVKDYFGRRATHVLDPTMLVDRTDYIGIIKNTTCSLKESNGELFCYVLDKAPVLSKVINLFFCNYVTPYRQLQNYSEKDECIVPPVEQWLKSFQDAEMVVTDSFHGTVFSILFNKPFWVIANKERGAARFISLLREFGLEDRILESDSSAVDWDKPITWSDVNQKLHAQRSYCHTLLSNNL